VKTNVQLGNFNEKLKKIYLILHYDESLFFFILEVSQAF